jgi:hypothetical protein
MWSGKPQVYEAFYNWMCPLGAGLLNQHAFIQTADRHVILNHPFLDLMGARYVVFDPANPGAPDPQSILNDLGQNYRVVSTNADFLVFANGTAHPYVTAYGSACEFVGDFRDSAPLALELSARGWPLVNADTELPGPFEKVYHDDSDTLPPLAGPSPVALNGLTVTRERDELVRIQATAPTNCLAVIAESYYPFWHATVDGQPAEVLRVDCGLMGLKLNTGPHEIVLQYAPPRSYAVTGAVSVAAFLACLGVIVVGGARSRRG